MRNLLLIFDMDGTVLDSMKQLTENAVGILIESYGKTYPQAKRMYDDTAGIPFRQQLERLFPDNPYNSESASYYERLHLEQSPAFPVAKDFDMIPHRIRRYGHLMVLVSSTDYLLIHQHTPQILSLGWNWIGGYRPGFSKTAQIQQVIAFLGPFWPHYIADTPHDYEVAKQLSVPFHLVTPDSVTKEVIDLIGTRS